MSMQSKGRKSTQINAKRFMGMSKGSQLMFGFPFLCYRRCSLKSIMCYEEMDYCRCSWSRKHRSENGTPCKSDKSSMFWSGNRRARRGRPITFSIRRTKRDDIARITMRRTKDAKAWRRVTASCPLGSANTLATGLRENRPPYLQQRLNTTSQQLTHKLAG
jgi:hypothetical protein